MKRFNITFKYKDEYSRGEWRTQSCSLYAHNDYEAKKRCYELYGLSECEYEITSVVEVNE